MATLVVLEWHRPAEEIAAYLAMLHEETEWDCFFCATDSMVPPFGLVDDQGEPKEEYYAFQAATGGEMSAIDERAAQLTPEILGEPLSDEIEMDGGIKIKAYWNGLLMEIPATGGYASPGVYAIAEATVAHLFRPAPA